LCDFHTSKSILHEIAHLYLAEDLRPATRPPDATEFIEVRAFPFAEVLAMVERGEIKDSMTVVAVLHAARRRGQCPRAAAALGHRASTHQAGSREPATRSRPGPPSGLPDQVHRPRR